MFEFGLTGGIGSGKSTVASGLVARGAILIDADAIVRELQEPGGIVLAEMVEHFGTGIVDANGRLDRQAVADIAFSDEEQLKQLNKIVHPRVMEEIARIRAQHDTSDAVVVMDIPLLVNADGTKNSRAEYDELLGVVVVDCDPDVAVGRLVEDRGFSEEDARARIANQATREARLAVADHVIDNSGSRADLEHLLDRCWSWMMAVTGGR